MTCLLINSSTKGVTLLRPPGVGGGHPETEAAGFQGYLTHTFGKHMKPPSLKRRIIASLSELHLAISRSGLTRPKAQAESES